MVSGQAAFPQVPSYSEATLSYVLYTLKGIAMRHPTSSRPPRTYISLSEASDYVGVCERTIRRWIADGRLCGYRVGPRILRVDRTEVDELFAVVPTAGHRRV